MNGHIRGDGGVKAPSEVELTVEDAEHIGRAEDGSSDHKGAPVRLGGALWLLYVAGRPWGSLLEAAELNDMWMPGRIALVHGVSLRGEEQ